MYFGLVLGMISGFGLVILVGVYIFDIIFAKLLEPGEVLADEIYHGMIFYSEEHGGFPK